MDDILDMIGDLLGAIMSAVGGLGATGSFLLVGTGSVALVWMVSRAMKL